MIPETKLDTALELIRQHNPHATVVTTPWAELTGEQLIQAMEGNASLAKELAAMEAEHHHDEHCGCGHDHEHHHDEHCGCGHDHEHHHHHADEVFTSWGVETPKKFSQEEIARILEELDSGEYGIILRAKGIIPGKDGKWIHFDHVPGEADIRTGGAGVTGRLCVIGSKLDEQGVARLFGV